MKANIMNLSEIIKVVDKDIKNKLSGENIIFSDSIIKINKKLIEQNRILIITEKALYNFKEKTLKRRLPIKDIIGITTSKTSNEFVIHGKGDEYDYHYKYPKKRKIIQILAAAYYFNTNGKLSFCLVKEDNLHNYVTLGTEKKKDKNKTKMSKQYTIDIDTYLYGNLMRSNSISRPRKGINFASVMKTHKTEIVFLNEESIDLIKHIQEIKIENFRALGKLIKSYYGQIHWCEFIPNNTFYLMRIINNSDINNFILDIGKIIALYSIKFLSISPAECIIKTEEKTFILNKFNPYFEGGPLFYHLKNSGTFNEEKTKVIAAQIIHIILFFHNKDKKHLNFSPENFILDKSGFVNYLWFEINEDLFYDKCKPEILKPIEYTQINNDWYNLGVLIYEMLLNISPLNYIDSNGNIKFPKFIGISNEAKEIILKLMSMKNENDEMKLEDIKKYKFFEGINFDDVLNRKIESGIVPMNLEQQKINNMGMMIDDSQKDMKEEMEKERYTLFNYDSNDENDDI